MKKLLAALLLLAVVSAGVGYRFMSQITRGESRAASPEIVQFLLDSAAADFHAHGRPAPARFRDVRVGHVVTPGGEKQYRLCGQFLPGRGVGKDEWTAFSTIKTSDYEQWIGGQSAAFCKDPSMVWDDVATCRHCYRAGSMP